MIVIIISSIIKIFILLLLLDPQYSKAGSKSDD